jgi:hydrogenase maturation protease
MRVLVAGIGNIFLSDDGFGCEVLRRLTQLPLAEGVRAVDFGIRGLDLAYALLERWEAAIFVDAMPRGGKPGTLYLFEPAGGGPPSIEAHSMDPARVLSFARELGQVPPVLRVLGCEPATVEEGIGLSAQVAAAVEPAIARIDELLTELGHA